MTEQNPKLIEVTAQVVSAFVGNNAIQAQDVPGLIKSVHSTFCKLEEQAAEEALPEPAIPVKKSITPDYIICLEDGKKFKSIKRHLRSKYDMSPEEYRAKWGLPHDYPMVAPNYSVKRSGLAKKMGLGQRANGTA